MGTILIKLLMALNVFIRLFIWSSIIFLSIKSNNKFAHLQYFTNRFVLFYPSDL